jgi:four helix bundle protein
MRNNLKHRCFEFSLDIIDFVEEISMSSIYKTLGMQVLRSATSIGANITEAQAGRTKRDFINYYHIALKSANETRYWLAILKIKLKDLSKEKASILLNESIEISKMIGASLITLKRQRTF